MRLLPACPGETRRHAGKFLNIGPPVMISPLIPTDLSFSILTSPAQLEAISVQWRELLATSSRANTFLTPEWLLSWWGGYEPAAQLQCLTAAARGQLVGIAPMMLSIERRHGLPVRCLRFMGDGTFETDHMGFITTDTGGAAIQRALLDELLRLDWDIAEFAQVPESSSLIRTLHEWCGSHRLMFHTQAAACPVRHVPDSFDALLASMPSRFRTTIRSTRRKLAAAYTVEFGLHAATTEFGVALQTLFDNHESRWRAKGQSGVFVNPKRRKFYELLTRSLHERGALRFFYLKLDGRIVAQEYCFAYGRTVYLLQEGFDYEMAHLNLGNALRSYVFEYLIENKYENYDFLGGLSRHKQTWSDSAPNDLSLSITRPVLKGRYIHHAPVAIERVKSVLRPLKTLLKPKTPPPAAQEP